MKYRKSDTQSRYVIQIREHSYGSLEPKEFVLSTTVWTDWSGLAGLIRSVDLATNEAKVARALGLPRKRPKKKEG